MSRAGNNNTGVRPPQRWKFVYFAWGVVWNSSVWFDSPMWLKFFLLKILEKKIFWIFLKTTHLFPRMNMIIPNPWLGSSIDKNAGQLVPIHLILLDEPFSIPMHKNSAVFPVENLIFPNNRIRTFWYPNREEFVVMEPVFQKLAGGVLVDAYAAGHSVMNLAFGYCRVGLSTFQLYRKFLVCVDLTVLEVAQAIAEIIFIYLFFLENFGFWHEKSFEVFFFLLIFLKLWRFDAHFEPKIRWKSWELTKSQRFELVEFSKNSGFWSI